MTSSWLIVIVNICSLRFLFWGRWHGRILSTQCKCCKYSSHHLSRCDAFLRALAQELPACPSFLYFAISISSPLRSTFWCWCISSGRLECWFPSSWLSSSNSCSGPNLHTLRMCNFLLTKTSMIRSTCKSRQGHILCIFLFLPFLGWFLLARYRICSVWGWILALRIGGIGIQRIMFRCWWRCMGTRLFQSKAPTWHCYRRWLRNLKPANTSLQVILFVFLLT